MKKVLLSILITIWFIIAIFTTVCLLSYNDYKVTEFGSYSLINVDSDALEPDFKEGSLLIVKRVSDKKIAVSDDVFYYDAQSKKALVNLGEVESVESVTEDETTFGIKNAQSISGEMVIGRASDTTVIPVIGTILMIIESQWGFMFLVIFPALFLFVYEIYSIVMEIKEGKKAKQ